MEITIAGQTWMFLHAILLGAVLGVCYDFFRIFRIALPHTTGAVAAEDILFALICTAVTLLFFLQRDCGRIRMFVLIGEGIGFVLYACTVGVLVIGVSRRMIAVVRWVILSVWRWLLRPVVRLIETIGKFLAKILKKLANCLKIRVENSKMHLKKHSGLLYNLRKPSTRGRRKKKMQSEAERHE